MIPIRHIASGLVAALGIAGAQAATVYSYDFSVLGEMESPGSLGVSFAAGAGAGTIAFQLAGYNTLDGDDFWIDIFHLSVNGQEVFSGTFDMHGGGTDRVLLAPDGATATRVDDFHYAISVPTTLAGGTNNVVFSYESPVEFEGSSRAGPQGLGDEGWGLGQVTITGAVPEPQRWALLLAGVALVGGLRRRRATARN